LFKALTFVPSFPMIISKHIIRTFSSVQK
jgi:hypothetical protein